jgi:hypothetical protein
MAATLLEVTVEGKKDRPRVAEWLKNFVELMLLCALVLNTPNLYI